MSLVVLASIAACLLALVTASALVPLAIRISLAVRAVDYPGGRRLETEAIPRLGGVAIAAGIALGAGLPGLFVWFYRGGSITVWEMATLVLGTGLIFLVGLSDDVIGLTPVERFLVQGVAAVSVVYAGWWFELLYIPLWGEVALGFWGGIVTIFWIVGVTNAINLLDGLDGLAGGVSAIIATSLLVISWIQGSPLTVILMAATVGASLGFLRHNWAPAQIYMGDSGSLTLGFLLAIMSLHGSIKGATAVAILVPILALGLPVIDTLLVMAVRFAQKPQGSHVRRFARMFRADRNHLHHLMVRIAPERKEIVLAIYAVAACFCGMALLVALSRSTVLGVALVTVEVCVVLVMRTLGIRGEARLLSDLQRRQIREVILSVDPAPANVDEEERVLYAKRR